MSLLRLVLDLLMVELRLVSLVSASVCLFHVFFSYTSTKLGIHTLTVTEVSLLSTPLLA